MKTFPEFNKANKLCLDESSTNATTPPTGTQPQRCGCGAIDLNSPEGQNHICSGISLLQGIIRFPLQKQKASAAGEEEEDEGRQYVGLLLPRLRPRSKAKSRNKLPQSCNVGNNNKSRLPLDVDVNKFPPSESGLSKRIKLDPQEQESVEHDDLSKKEATKSPSDERDEKPPVPPQPGDVDDKAENADVNGESGPQHPLLLMLDDFCPFHFIPEYLGTNGERFIECARRGCSSFKLDFGIDLFDATPGAGRGGGRGQSTTTSTSEFIPGPGEWARDKLVHWHKQGLVLSDDDVGLWTPFNSVDILPRVLQTMHLEFQKMKYVHQEKEEKKVVVEKVDKSSGTTSILRVEKFAQTEEMIKSETYCPQTSCTCHWNKEPKTATDVGVGTHSDEEENKSPEIIIPTGKMEIITCKIGNAVIPQQHQKQKSPTRSKFSLPHSTPTPPPRSTPFISSNNTNLSSSYSSHLYNSKSSSKHDVIPPMFESFENFPPLSNSNQDSGNRYPSSTSNLPAAGAGSGQLPSSSSSAAAAAAPKRIPSLMDLKITLPLHPLSQNPSAIVIKNRKGRPRLPTIADAIQQSMFNSPNLGRSSKLSNNKKMVLSSTGNGTAAAAAEINNNEYNDPEEGCSSSSSLFMMDLPPEGNGSDWSSSAGVSEEQDAIRKNHQLLYSWPLDKSALEKMDTSLSSEEESNSPYCTTANSPRSSILDAEDSSTPTRVLKIGRASQCLQQQQQRHRGIHAMFQSSILPASQQPRIQNSIMIQQLMMTQGEHFQQNFTQDWKETKASLVCLGEDGKAEFKRISSLPEN